MTKFTTPPTLTGNLVRLEPLDIYHHDDLVEAVKDGELWNLLYTFTPSTEDMRKDILQRLKLQKTSQWMPFAIIDINTGEAIGMTGFININMTFRRVEIGATLDGKLRNHMICKDNTVRETYVYSIIESEWPAVKTKLTEPSKTAAA